MQINHTERNVLHFQKYQCFLPFFLKQTDFPGVPSSLLLETSKRETISTIRQTAVRGQLQMTSDTGFRLREVIGGGGVVDAVVCCPDPCRTDTLLGCWWLLAGSLFGNCPQLKTAILPKVTPLPGDSPHPGMVKVGCKGLAPFP